MVEYFNHSRTDKVHSPLTPIPQFHCKGSSVTTIQRLVSILTTFVFIKKSSKTLLTREGRRKVRRRKTRPEVTERKTA